jgi:putative ABC transport system permease protein
VSFRDSLVMLVVAVGFVLLVACANVAHLLMARSATRQRELAVRAALGAGRGRLLRQLLTESFLLSIAGAMAGVAVGWVGLRALIAARPRDLSELGSAHLDGFTLGVAILVAVASGIAFGIIGALQSARSSTHDALKTGASQGARRGIRGRGRGLLVVSEMALSAALVVSATMLVRSVIKLQRADLGFSPTGLYSLDLNMPQRRYPSPATRVAFLNELVSRATRIPGVRSVSLAGAGPGARNFAVGRLEIEGEPAPAPTSSSFIDVNNVQPNYFSTMGIRLIEGSTFTDTASRAGQILVNAGFARKHWPGTSAIGHRLRIARQTSEPWMTIVGVVGDASLSGPTAESSAPFIYRAFGDDESGNLVVRTGGDAAPMQQIRAFVKSADRAMVPTVNSAEEMVSRAIAGPRFVMTLLTVFTALALVLAAVGMYGVMAYTVAQRTREIGIRLALGAPAGRIARSVLVRGAMLAVIGSIIGLSAAAWGTKLIEHQLYGVTRSDPASFVAAVVVLVGAAVLACAVPTRRALSVDPMTAIRAD